MGLAESHGAIYLGNNQCDFRVWAPYLSQVDVHIVAPEERLVPLERRKNGYFCRKVENVPPGTRYFFRLDGKKERPDPASRYQPEGVHGPSEVTDPSFPWEDLCWFGIPLRNYVIYELHVGLFTPEGTFEALIAHLDWLNDLGVTAIELMPIAQFPGSRNWGYDGAYPYAPQNSYGGPTGLRRLVNAAHKRNMMVALDVVYNHFGPEGSYIREFGPYFTQRCQTPWGDAINFDGPHSDQVRRFFIGNAVYWIEKFHIDALRLDATHAIFDISAEHFLEEMAAHVKEAAERMNRRAHLFAESDLNDVRYIRPPELGGLAMNAQWNDDFHHALFTLLPGAKATAYLNDYGKFRHLAKSYEEGYVYSGEYSVYRQRRHGNSSRLIHGKRFVVFTQNHDQVGNRLHGDRLCSQISFEAVKAAAGAVILSPFLPMLFMGEEYCEPAPFLYFVSHSDPELVDAVRRGRKEELKHFFEEGEPPDPQDEKTFFGCKLNPKLRHEGKHKVLFDCYKELLRLRRTHPALSSLNKEHMQVVEFEKEKVLVLQRAWESEEAVIVLSLNEKNLTLSIPVPDGSWTKLFDSADPKWLGPGSSIPAQTESHGEVLLKLNPTSIFLLTKENSE